MFQKVQGNNMCYILETFANCNDQEHQNTQQIFYIFEISKSTEPTFLIKINENVHLNVSNEFSKFDGSKKIKV